MTTFSPRRVVTGHVDGKATFLSDGPPPNTVAVPDGFGVTEVLWLDGRPTDVDAGRDRDDGGYPLEPPPGGLSSRIIHMPGNGDWLRIPEEEADLPGMHATDTLDLMVVLDGEIVLGLADGELALRAGDFVVQQGTRHRWKVVGDRPCTYAVTMLRPDPAQRDVSLPVVAGDSGIRRVASRVAAVGEAPTGLQAGGTSLVDVWQTGGPVASVGQGGDVEGPWALEPAGGGVSFRWLEIGPREWGADEGWHTTATIDVDIILAGRMALELPGDQRVELSAGDVVVQRGTEHRWLPLDGAPARMAAVMVAV